MTVPIIKSYNSAEYLYANIFVERIEALWKNFAKKLNEDEAYWLYIILNDGSRIYVSSFGYYNPTIVTVKGTNEKKQEIQCMLHMNSFQVVMLKDKKSVLEKPQEIGFPKSNQPEK
jgi:hypothetical protein